MPAGTMGAVANLSPMARAVTHVHLIAVVGLALMTGSPPLS